MCAAQVGPLRLSRCAAGCGWGIVIHSTSRRTQRQPRSRAGPAQLLCGLGGITKSAQRTGLNLQASRCSMLLRLEWAQCELGTDADPSELNQAPLTLRCCTSFSLMTRQATYSGQNTETLYYHCRLQHRICHVTFNAIPRKRQCDACSSESL